ncbi:MAG: maleylacetoacetate isomerase [Gammaproteobacteria bacterium]|nr:maleylacetoacetate isomerase [Gammaproteobacteria bacterium]
MKLYSYYRSSAAYRARIALNLKGCAYELVPVHLIRDGGAHRRPDYLGVNPQGLVPALDDDGTIVTQSLAIVEYLDARFPEPRLIPRDPAERARVQSLAQIVACDIHPLNNLRVRRYLADELGLDQDGVAAWSRRWIADGFRALEARLAQWSGGRYCYGDGVTIADVMLAPQVYNARALACDLGAYPTLVRVADHLATLDAFVRAAPENQPDAD